MRNKHELAHTSDYAKALRQWRRQRGLRQRELAWLLRVSTDTVCRWELGYSTPWPRHQERVQALMVALDAGGRAAPRSSRTAA